MKRLLLILFLLAWASPAYGQSQSTPHGLERLYDTTTELVVDGREYAQTRAGVQAAIDALPAAGGRVIIPRSTIDIDQALVITGDYVELVGVGPASVLRLAANLTATSPGDMKNILEVTNSSYVTVRNLCLDGNYTNQAMATLTMRFAAAMEGTGGFTIQYVGGGSAGTYTKSGTSFTTSITGAPEDNLSLTLTDAAYDSLGELVAYIDGLANYTATINSDYLTNSYTPGMNDAGPIDIKTAPVAVAWNSNGDPSSIEVYGNCLIVEDSDHVRIDSILAKNAPHICVCFYSGTTDSIITGCSLHTANWRPVEIWPDDGAPGGNAISNIVVANNIVGDSYNTPIAVEYTNNSGCVVMGNVVRLTDATFSDGAEVRAGIHVYKGGGHTVTNNTTYGCGIIVSPDTGSLKNNIVANNHIDYAYSVHGDTGYVDGALNLEEGDHFIVTGNTVLDAYYAGIRLSGVEHCVVSGNMVTANVYGIYVGTGSNSNLIRDNRLTSTLNVDIIVGAGANNNVCVDNWTTDVTDNGTGTTWIDHQSTGMDFGAANQYAVTWNGTDAVHTVAATNGGINLVPNGVGDVEIDGLHWPAADGTPNYYLKTDGAGQLSWGAGGSGLSDVVDDLTPQLGGDLYVNGHSILSATAGNIAITPDTTGSIVLDGLNWPQADGTAGYVLKTDGAGQIGFAAKQDPITGAATTIDTEDLTIDRALISSGAGKVAVSSVTATELGYVSGVTSALQTQLGAKQATITGGATTIDTEDLTASRALVSDGSGKVAVATTTATEIGYVNGVTSALQTQLGTKLGIAPRVVSVTTETAGYVTPTSDTADLYCVTALDDATEFAAPSGTPSNGQILTLRIDDDGTGRALTWNAVYAAFAALPSTTVATKTIYVGLRYNSTTSKWDVLAVQEEN